MREYTGSGDMITEGCGAVLLLSSVVKIVCYYRGLGGALRQVVCLGCEIFINVAWV